MENVNKSDLQQEQAQEAQESVRLELQRLRKVLKQSSKNELISLALNLVLELSDLKNGAQALLIENKELKSKLSGSTEG